MRKEILCSVCGFKIDKTRHVRSKYTGNYYCSDLDGCHRRARSDLTMKEVVEMSDRITRFLS